MTKRRGSAGKTILFFAMLLLFPMARKALCAGNPTILHGIRSGSHGSYERLVFDLQGDQPSRVCDPTEEGITIEFALLETRVKPEKVASQLSSVISGLTFQKTDGGSMIRITIRDRDTSIKPFFTAWRPGYYRLGLDFFPHTPQKSPDSTGGLQKGRAPATAASPASTALPASLPAPAPSPTPVTARAEVPATGEKDGKKAEAHAGSPSAQLPQGFPLPPAKGKGAKPVPAVSAAKAEELYATADATFKAGENNLVSNAPQVISQYIEAIKANPASPQLPLALYRCGLTYLTAGEPKKAEEYFKRVVSDYPTHSSAPLCWLGLGKINQQRKSFAEAIHAFRTAVNSPMEKTRAAEAYFSLGKTLITVGAIKESIDVLKKSLSEDPFYYRREPELLKALGEATFATQQYDKSSEYFLWYLNLQKDVPDRDMVMAKIAETLLYKGEPGLANKIYAFIETHYPESEGFLISKIRRAEFIERKEKEKGGSGGAAMPIYEELAGKTLPPSLAKLIFFKLATGEWKQGNYEKSLALTNLALQVKNAGEADDDLLKLKEKATTDWLKKAYSDKDHAKVIQLYEDNQPYFQSLDPPETGAMIADGYANLKRYSNAVNIYDKLLARQPKKNDEWLFKVGQYCYIIGEVERAAQACQLIQGESYEVAKTELLGQIYLAQKKSKDFLQYFGKVLQNEKNYMLISYQLLQAYVDGLVQAGRYAEAVGTMQKLSKRLGEEDMEKRIQLSLLQSKCYQNLKQPDKAIGILEETLPMIRAENLKDQLNYQLSMLYMETGQQQKATEKLTQLLESSQGLWKAAAQQQLDYLQMQSYQPKN